MDRFIKKYHLSKDEVRAWVNKRHFMSTITYAKGSSGSCRTSRDKKNTYTGKRQKKTQTKKVVKKASTDTNTSGDADAEEEKKLTVTNEETNQVDEKEDAKQY